MDSGFRLKIRLRESKIKLRCGLIRLTFLGFDRLAKDEEALACDLFK